jgi:DNA-directed RNA polymerase specialized sigma subunit
MDKPKESKVRTRVMEILRNHDQEARVIEAQIAAEKEALEADLEFILESAYPSSQLSDAGVRVQSSPDPDGRLVRMVDKRDRRRQRANEAIGNLIGNLERQLQQITEVQNLVYTLDTRSKCVLLALYYPYRSYDEAAEFLQVERTTVYRQREIALNRLFARAERSKAFRE